MKKIIYCTALAAVALSGTIYALSTSGSAKAPAREEAKTDYTDLIANPSFENYTPADADRLSESNTFRGWAVTAPAGWTYEGLSAVKKLIVDKDCDGDNGFGTYGDMADGNYAFYLRFGWGTTGTSEVSQTISALPAGNYTLSCAVKSGYVNGATSSIALIADSKKSNAMTAQAGSAGFMAANAWKPLSITFNHKTAGDVEITIFTEWQEGGSCFAIDNFKLTRNGDAAEDEEPVIEPASPTEGTITHDFVNEADMKADLNQMLANFAQYMVNNVQTISSKNNKNESMISFKGENTLGNNEQGVRHNADMSMICAYLAKYAKGTATLPEGITWEQIEDLAMKSLVYSYSTHRANKFYACKDNNYWGSASGAGQWESSLWAMSVAYSAFFQWHKLNDTQKAAIEAMLVSECDYELNRTIPTGYAGDTKAEENGWEVDILAATLGLFPEHAKASKWYDRMREFAINSYSHSSDAADKTVIDPEYDNKTVADLYKGQNLYDDWTLQNHNLFHTSYQNVVMQELGEAALALKLFQTGLYGKETWKSNALMHHNKEVMDNVLNWLALADGELAMPNGNDWSLFLFDQITSYSTMACFLRDPHALLLENMAYKNIKARQTTTGDGSWLLRADVGGRRMGVEGHRVMMTALMHEVLPTADITATTWPEFQQAFSKTKFFPAQNVIRSMSPSRFTTFSWSDGLKSYTGYLTSNNPDNNKMIVPLRQNNTGNFLGWYTVTGKSTDASPIVKGIYQMFDDAYVMNGELSVNGAALDNRFAIYSTPGNAVIYLDYVSANADCKITKEGGGLMAISMDEFMKTQRKFYTADSPEGQTLDALKFTKFDTDWANIDNELGFVAVGNRGMGFGERSANNSIMTARFYPLYSTEARSVTAGQKVDARNVIYYTSVNTETTKALRDKVQNLADKTPEGWNGVLAADPDGTYYLALANFKSLEKATLSDVETEFGAPVFSTETQIKNNKSTADFIAQINNSCVNVIRAFVKGANVTAIQDADDNGAIYLQNDNAAAVKPTVTIIADGKAVTGSVDIKAGASVKVSVVNGAIVASDASFPKTGIDFQLEGYTEITDLHLKNAGFEEDETYGKVEDCKVGTTTYPNAYVNDVDPLDAAVVNILPVKGWTNETNLESTVNNRPFRRMYSMPYSLDNVCASAKGNYTANCPPIIGNDRIGKRVLTVLNSWGVGNNAISQTLNLPDGEYRMLVTAKYSCSGQADNADGKVTTGTDNVNSSLIGVEYNGTTLYKYPTTADQWETMVYDFALDQPTKTAVRVGYNTSHAVGAANNTLLYVDDIRLFRKGGTGVSAMSTASYNGPVYSLDGVMVRKAGEISSEQLPAGIYIQGNRKFIVR